MKQMLEKKNILLISVSFFNYENLIKKQLERMGASVDLFDERPSNSFFSKAIIRIKKEVYSVKINQYFKDIIEKLNPVQFNWNQKAKGLNKEKDERNNYGLIAQEVEEILPELIHPIYDKYKSVDYEQLIPILIQSIKELKEEVDTLKNKINNEK